ncbi:MAG: HAMP domain-containing sensor histidine kinase [Owenweeksia sp.]|nr:HAMP domain-containing sensor histidine kinase [Owenweeksia sp.]
MRLNVQHLRKSLPTDDPDKLEDFTQSMISQIDTLGGIAEAFSRFANMPELKSEKFPAREIIERVTALYPGYDIQFDCEDPEAIIFGDKDQLVRVMNNLINNSIQAIPKDREAVLKVRMARVRDELQISLSDNGTGIPQEQGDKIFEPRFTTKSGGMGLGLAMVKNIIDSFKGSIWYESAPQKGTTFYISLPLA